jgi:hypothetical protein
MCPSCPYTYYSSASSSLPITATHITHSQVKPSPLRPSPPSRHIQSNPDSKIIIEQRNLAYLRNNLSTGRHLTGLSLIAGFSTSHAYCSISTNSHPFRSPSKPFLKFPWASPRARSGSSDAGQVCIGGAMVWCLKFGCLV